MFFAVVIVLVCLGAYLLYENPAWRAAIVAKFKALFPPSTGTGPTGSA